MTTSLATLTYKFLDGHGGATPGYFGGVPLTRLPGLGRIQPGDRFRLTVERVE